MQESNRLRWLPIPMILAALCLLLIALWAGLARLGIPGVQSDQAMAHGPLMIPGILGTVISLERVVAMNSILRSRWKRLGFLVPVLSAAGGALLAAGWQNAAPQFLMLLASVGLVLIFVIVLTHHAVIEASVMALGAVALLIGNMLWVAERPLFEVVHWWAAFLILTVVGERLELSRIRRITSRQRWYLLTIISAYLVGVALTLVNLEWGTRLTGLSFFGMACWLIRYDVARVTIRRGGLPQYAASCLLSGYVWLGIGGMIALWQGALYAGLFYEAFLHALMLGFVFSMIFGHAPIIIPALTGQSVGFHRVLYLPLLLLHGSLILRIASNLIIWLPGRQWGGILNVTSLLLFFGLMPVLLMKNQVNPRPTATLSTKN